MSHKDLIDKIEKDIKAHQETIDLGAAVERLRKNKDFVKVITEGYLSKEAVRLVHSKGQPQCQTPEKQARIMRDIDGIGSLVQFLDNILTFAGMAGSNVAEAEMELEVLRADDLANTEGGQ